LLSYITYFGTHNNSGAGYDLGIQIVAFLLALPLPAFIGLAGQRGWWSICKEPVGLTPSPSPSRADGEGRKNQVPCSPSPSAFAGRGS
jgi:hypothetical protein